MDKIKFLKYQTVFIAVFLLVITSKADTWGLPTIKDYYSVNKNYFIRITPTFIPKKYSAWKYASPKKKLKFLPKDTTIIPCHAILYKRVHDNDSLIWKENLINYIAPESAIVSNDGKYLITFDNWASLGYGVNVLVVYNHQGEMIKRHNLEEISPFPINKYMISVSSMWWRCGAEFTDNKNIKLCFLDKEKNVESRNYSLQELKIK